MHTVHVLYLFSKPFFLSDHRRMLLSPSVFVGPECLKWTAYTTRFFSSSGITVLFPPIINRTIRLVHKKPEKILRRLVCFDYFENTSSFVEVSQQPNVCELEVSSQPWSWIPPHWGFLCFGILCVWFRHHIVHTHVFMNVLYSLSCNIILFHPYYREGGRWPNHVTFFGARHIYEHLFTLLCACVCAQLLNFKVKYSPLHRFFWLSLIKSLRWINGTSSLPH